MRSGSGTPPFDCASRHLERLPQVHAGALYVSSDYKLPKQCLRCGTGDDLVLTEQRLSRRDALVFHLCPTCSRAHGHARKLARVSNAILVAGALASVAVAVVSPAGGLAVLTVLLVLVALFRRWGIRGRTVEPKKVALPEGWAIRVGNVEYASVDDWPQTDLARLPYRGEPRRCPHCDFAASEFRRVDDASVCPACGRSFEATDSSSVRC